jgi:hypothetical protein
MRQLKYQAIKINNRSTVIAEADTVIELYLLLLGLESENITDCILTGGRLNGSATDFVNTLNELYNI